MFTIGKRQNQRVQGQMDKQSLVCPYKWNIVQPLKGCSDTCYNLGDLEDMMLKPDTKGQNPV